MNLKSRVTPFCKIALFVPMWTAILCIATANAQFVSGSDGSDGALDFSAFEADTTVIFDPKDPTTFDHPTTPPNPTRVLDPDGDNVYHFTTIIVPAAITVKLRADKLNQNGVTPIIWLPAIFPPGRSFSSG